MAPLFVSGVLIGPPLDPQITIVIFSYVHQDLYVHHIFVFCNASVHLDAKVLESLMMTWSSRCTTSSPKNNYVIFS